MRWRRSCCHVAAGRCSASISKAAAARAAPTSTSESGSGTWHWPVAAAGITPGTVRLSIGLEDADDLIDDLKRAFKVAEKAA